jgi:hypothetical protein
MCQSSPVVAAQHRGMGILPMIGQRPMLTVPFV